MKKLLLMVMCLAIAAPVLAADGFVLRNTRGPDLDVRVDVPNARLAKREVDGKTLVAVGIDKSRLTQELGLPELPVMSALVMLPFERNPSVTIANKQCQVVSLEGRVMPSKGRLTRNIDPTRIPLSFDKMYETDAWYPSDDQLVQVGAPFIFRDVRGVRLEVNPVQYNPVKKQLRIYRNFTLKIAFDQPATNLPKRGRVQISSVFEPLYKSFFINFARQAARLPRLEENGRLLIVAPDELADAAMPLLVWKKKCGLDARLVKLSEIGGANSTAIKDCIQKEFDRGGLTHVVLVGDVQQMPTLKGVKENADSDPCYVKLAGNDHVPDAMISRISATTADEVAYQVAKFINYEQYPSTGDSAAWYTKAMGIASAEGNPTDFERCNELRNALLANNRFTAVDQIYDKAHVTSTGGGSAGGYPPYPGFPPHVPGMPGPHLPPMMDYSIDRDGSVTAALSLKDQIAVGVNEGRSLINYIGHGSKTTWVTSGFSVADCQNKLQNGWKLPFIIDVACVNGAFAAATDCFAEAWMKAGNLDSPRGAVGIFAASTNMEWVPPCIVQAEITKNYIVNNLYKTAGGLMMNGIMKGLEQYGIEPKGSGVMMAEQWHWFGDCTTLVRTRVPSKIECKVSITAAEGNSRVEATVADANGALIEGARVTCYTDRFETVAGACTDAAGKASFSMPVARGTTGYVTVVGSDLIPIVDQPVQF